MSAAGIVCRNDCTVRWETGVESYNKWSIAMRVGGTVQSTKAFIRRSTAGRCKLPTARHAQNCPLRPTQDQKDTACYQVTNSHAKTVMYSVEDFSWFFVLKSII